MFRQILAWNSRGRGDNITASDRSLSRTRTAADIHIKHGQVPEGGKPEETIPGAYMDIFCLRVFFCLTGREDRQKRGQGLLIEREKEGEWCL